MAKPPKLGTGARFQALKAKLAAKDDVDDPDAVAASIGRKKYGPKFSKLAAMTARGKSKSS